MSEKKIQNDIVSVLGRNSDFRVFRNNVGSAWAGKSIQVQSEGFRRVYGAYPVKFGLCKGSSDLIGIKRIEITQDMVGKIIGQFVAVEVKGPKGRTSTQQKDFLKMVSSMGGLAEVCRSKEDAEALL